MELHSNVQNNRPVLPVHYLQYLRNVIAIIGNECHD